MLLGMGIRDNRCNRDDTDTQPLLNDWNSQHFRQKMIDKIEDSITFEINNSSQLLEYQIYSIAKSQDEYLKYIATLIMEIEKVCEKRKQLLKDRHNKFIEKLFLKTSPETKVKN